jgi:hypothetical protein
MQYVLGVRHCWEKAVTIMLRMIIAFLRSVAARSMKAFFVSGLMRLCQPLMIGGSENTGTGRSGKCKRERER